ncbi:MAG: cytidylate kinase family protein [Candidatus Falkowbacteria bacterium]
MIITISGNPGSGKSTVTKKLARKLDWPKFYMGKIRRLKAGTLGLTLTEYNKLGEKNPSTDIEVDNYLKRVARQHKNCIIESRTAWHFLPKSIKIFVDVNEKIGAKRVFAELKKHNKRNEDKKLNTLKAVLASHRQRKQSDDKRYRKYYNFKIFNKNNYDFILDTTNLNKKQVFDKVYNYLKNRLKPVDKTS